jgi:hypothetical protein
MRHLLYEWYWAIWIVVLFGGPEAIALATGHPEDTLSEVTWHWFDVAPGQTIWTYSIQHFILVVLMTWLYFHIVFGIFRHF